MKELIKKQYEDCRKAYENLEDKTSAAALQLLGAIGAYEKLCPELKEDEDARIFAELTSLFEDGIKGISHYYTGEDCGRWLAWFKKQCEQKTFWSEEKEKLVNNLISTLSNLYARNLIEKETKEKYINLLKSLRLPNKWKPTAAQMYALKQEVENKIYSGGNSDLSSLYHDLIKLL